MKFSRKQRLSKPPVIKRNPAQVNRFHRKENQTKLSLEDYKLNRRKPFGFSDNQQVKKFDFQASPPDNNQLKPSEATPPKNWWIHLWSGLVLEQEGKHKRAIRQAIWLYLYLLLVASRETGRLYRRLSTITLETGFNPRSIQRWLKRLRDKGYIETVSNGRFLTISITKWKPISRRAKANPQSSSEQKQ